MKKVLFLITKSNWGGAQRYVFDLATHLPNDAYEVVVAVGGNGVLAEKLREAGIRVISIEQLQRDVSLFKEVEVAKTLFHLYTSERPDIVHINSSKAGIIGALMARIARVPRIIFTAHGWAFNEDRPRWQKLIIKFLHWCTVLLAHRTIAVSNGLHNQLSWPFAKRHMSVVFLGRDAITFLPKEEARTYLSSVSKAPLPSNAVVVGTIAELHPIKNLPLLLEAFATLTTTHPTFLYIIGEGEERARLQQTIKNHTLSNRVFLLGALPEAAQYLHAFDIFVLPSKSESFGYVLIEAGQAGLPLVASRVGGIPDIIRNEQEGMLFTSGDGAALTIALQTLCEDETKRATLGNAAALRAQDFSITTMVRATIAVYEARSSLD